MVGSVEVLRNAVGELKPFVMVRWFDFEEEFRHFFQLW